MTEPISPIPVKITCVFASMRELSVPADLPFI